jgi:CheY-like chemotaxis protein
MSVRPITELMCNWGKMYLPEYQFGAQRVGGLRILIVDREEETRLALKSTLEAREAEVFESASVLEALEIVRREFFDAIVVDMATPESNTLIARIRQETQQNREDGTVAIAERNRKFIALTSDEAERVRVFKAGFQVHLAKPFEPIELVAAIASLTGYIN